MTRTQCYCMFLPLSTTNKMGASFCHLNTLFFLFCLPLLPFFPPKLRERKTKKNRTIVYSGLPILQKINLLLCSPQKKNAFFLSVLSPDSKKVKHDVTSLKKVYSFFLLFRFTKKWNKTWFLWSKPQQTHRAKKKTPQIYFPSPRKKCDNKKRAPLFFFCIFMSREFPVNFLLVVQ